MLAYVLTGQPARNGMPTTAEEVFPESGGEESQSPQIFPESENEEEPEVFYSSDDGNSTYYFNLCHIFGDYCPKT